jgi:hypothetical protein
MQSRALAAQPARRPKRSKSWIAVSLLKYICNYRRIHSTGFGAVQSSSLFRKAHWEGLTAFKM